MHLSTVWALWGAWRGVLGEWVRVVASVSTGALCGRLVGQRRPEVVTTTPEKRHWCSVGWVGGGSQFQHDVTTFKYDGKILGYNGMTFT